MRPRCLARPFDNYAILTGVLAALSVTDANLAA